QVNMDMMPSLLENHDIRIAKNHFKLKSEIYNAKEIPVKSTVEFIKRSYSIKCLKLKRFTIELIQKFEK
ncbi:hypothetical protein, partial [Mycoplasmopsis synoviae]|uniref:hypothetical protein n=1 Tax=Mycoplasmopsis synoviae TaxID=2109 RepID=UPI00387B84C1